MQESVFCKGVVSQCDHRLSLPYLVDLITAGSVITFFFLFFNFSGRIIISACTPAATQQSARVGMCLWERPDLFVFLSKYKTRMSAQNNEDKIYFLFNS